MGWKGYDEQTSFLPKYHDDLAGCGTLIEEFNLRQPLGSLPKDSAKDTRVWSQSQMNLPKRRTRLAAHHMRLHCRDWYHDLETDAHRSYSDIVRLFHDSQWQRCFDKTVPPPDNDRPCHCGDAGCPCEIDTLNDILRHKPRRECLRGTVGDNRPTAGGRGQVDRLSVGTPEHSHGRHKMDHEAPG